MPEGAFGAFTPTTAALSAASFCSGDSTLTMLVDSGATHNFVDPLLTPGMQDMMSDYCVLDVPHTIVAAGQNVLQGVSTGTVQGTVIDDGGRERNFSLGKASMGWLKALGICFIPLIPFLPQSDLFLLNLTHASTSTITTGS